MKLNEKKLVVLPNLKKQIPIARRGKARSGREHSGVIVMIVGAGTDALANDQLAAGVDYTYTLDATGNLLFTGQKWLTDKSDATPVKLADGQPQTISLTAAQLAQFAALVDGFIQPIIVAQFGVQPAAVAPVTPATPVPTPAISVAPGASDGNGGQNWPITIANGGASNAVKLQYSTDGGNTWNVFGVVTNMPDGTNPLDTPNPTGVTGPAQVQAVITLAGASVSYSSTPISVTF